MSATLTKQHTFVNVDPNKEPKQPERKMGRKKITIARIEANKNRQVTFNKRKVGLMKKAMELSILCECEIAILVFSHDERMFQYASTNMEDLISRYRKFEGAYESLSNDDLPTLKASRASAAHAGRIKRKRCDSEDAGVCLSLEEMKKIRSRQRGRRATSEGSCSDSSPRRKALRTMPGPVPLYRNPSPQVSPQNSSLLAKRFQNDKKNLNVSIPVVGNNPENVVEVKKQQVQTSALPSPSSFFMDSFTQPGWEFDTSHQGNQDGNKPTSRNTATVPFAPPTPGGFWPQDLTNPQFSAQLQLDGLSPRSLFRRMSSSGPEMMSGLATRSPHVVNKIGQSIREPPLHTSSFPAFPSPAVTNSLFSPQVLITNTQSMASPPPNCLFSLPIQNLNFARNPHAFSSSSTRQDSILPFNAT